VVRDIAWVIYLIRFSDGSGYVGATKEIKRRIKEHRRTFGKDLAVEILEKGSSIDWRDAEYFWIEKLRRSGFQLRNKTSGRNGVQSLTPESRLKISLLQRGKIVSPETRARIGRAQKGVAKSFSAEGEIRAQKTRFRPGHKNWELLSEKAKRSHRAAAKAQWERIPPGERSRLASERARAEWDSRSENERAKIGERISEGKRRAASYEERALAARVGGLALHANDPEAAAQISRTMKSWWANMTPEYRLEYLARRTAARKAALENAKKS
jgi:hypothetical protein